MDLLRAAWATAAGSSGAASHYSSLSSGSCSLLAALPSAQLREIAAFEILSRTSGKEQSQGFLYMSNTLKVMDLCHVSDIRCHAE
ncbi:hypothetical protein NQZ68_003757 [Dissostichus eleginoides]|nr:hypothetical protein NQZ68_003757 [Dissostichus eleginoides]